MKYAHYLKRFLIYFFIVSCFLNTFSIYASSISPLFSKSHTYTIFHDVPKTAWYYTNVKAVYEYGIMNGKGNNTFDPDGTLTYAEGITLACRLHKLTHEGSSDFEPSTPWYQVYVDYANEHHMSVNDVTPSLYTYVGSISMDSTLPRSVFAKMISLALPVESLEEINSIEMGSIPDISLYRWDDMVRDDVYRLYRAGIITGKDAKGTFDPLSSLTRAETASIMSRVIDPSLRQKVTLTAPKDSYLTEKKVRTLIYGLNVGQITRIALADYDMDGKIEAFVVTEGEARWSNVSYYDYDVESYILFVSSGHADILCSAPGKIYFDDEDRLYDDFGAFKIFTASGDPILRDQYEGSGFVMYTVKDGKPERVDLPNYLVQEDELFPGVEPYKMSPIGTMYYHKLDYLPDQTAYLFTTTQTIYKESELGSASPFITTECLLEVNEKTHEFEWIMRRLSLSEAGYYDYEKAEAYIEANGTDGWIPSPEKKVQSGIVDW